MPDAIFKVYFLIWLIAAYAIRMPSLKQKRQIEVADSRLTRLETLLNVLAFVGMQVIPLVYVLTSWLGVADYHVAAWVGWIGVALFAVALWLLWRAHVDLGHNWSPTLQVMEQHALVTRGIYGTIRHPIYAAHWLWAIGQALLLPNWIAGLAGPASFLPIYLYRIPREERMMLDHFGEAYRSYMDRTGRVIPRL